MIKHSLALRVLALSFCLIALPLLIDSFFFFQHSYLTSIQEGRERLRWTANTRSYGLTEIAPFREQFMMSELATIFELHKAKLDQKALSRSFSESSDLLEQKSAFYLLDAKPGDNFTVLASSDLTSVGKSFPESATELKEMIDAGKRHYLAYLGATPVSIDVLNLEEQQRVFLKVSNLEEVIQRAVAPVKEKPMIKMALVGDTGTTFAASDSTLIGKTFPLTQKMQHLFKGDDPPYFTFILDETAQLGYQERVADLGVFFVAYTPKVEMFSEAIEHFLLLYSIYGFILVVGGGVTFWLVQWISRPFAQLIEVMKKVGSGHVEARFQEQALGFEINLLGQSFNQTVGTLLDSMQKAEDQRVLKETYKKELQIGKEVQRQLFLHQIPSFPKLEIAGNYIYGEEVGGDFYDLLKRPGEVVLTVSDAAGKGVSACLYSLGVRSLLRTCATLYSDVGTILAKANHLFLKDTGETGMYTTVLMGILNLETREFSYFSCGHVPGIIRRADGRIEMLQHQGMAMGLVEMEQQYQAEKTTLAPGDLVLFYTDGLINVENSKHQPFSTKRLTDILQQRRWLSAQQVVDGLTAEVTAFMQNQPQNDEITILALRCL